jgi:hypothetical protein
MLSIKNNLQVIAASYQNFLGWTITKSTDLHDRDELLIYPQSESDFDQLMKMIYLIKKMEFIFIH